jgi:hypothetical protein
MALIKRINQFNLDSNLTGNELILTMDNGITKNMMLDNVKDFILNNDNSLTDLGFITSPNTITQDITLPEDSNVYYYGDLSIASGYTLTIPSGTTLTIIDANQVTTTVTGGTYDNGTATFVNSDNTSFDVTGFYTGTTTLPELGFNVVPNEINQDITLPDNSTVYYYGDLNMGSDYTLTIPSGTTLEFINPNLDVTVTGGTYDNGIATFVSNDNTSFDVAGFYTGSTTLPELGFNIIPNEINQDITLPDNSTIYYYGDLNMGLGYTLTIPINTTLEIIGPILDVTVTGGTYDNGTATFVSNDNTSFDVAGFYTGTTTLPELGFNVVPNEINQDVTLPDNSTVYYYGDLNMGSDYTLTIPSGTTLEFITQNETFVTGDTNNNSVLIGGINNIIDSLTNNSVVIGGIDITGTTSNTVYVPNLNINNLTTGDALNNLAIDSNGNVVISDLYSLSDLGFNITSRPSTVIHQNIVLPENSDVTYPSPLTMDVNNTIIVPIDTILTII